MDPPFPGFVLDPSKCRKLNIEQKQGLIREIAKWPETASEKLQSWSRKDLLEVLCFEMGKERKYPGMTKSKMIDQLLRVVSAKNPPKNLPEPSSESSEEDADVAPAQKPSKRPRKSDCPTRVPIEKVFEGKNENKDNSKGVCENIACRCEIREGDEFCKKCTCCVCRNHDENRDPSLWIFCGDCGAAFHVACGIDHAKFKNGFCANCDEEIDLLLYWKKQLVIAKSSRRLDVLYQRISLSHKLLNSNEKYKSLHEIVDNALKKLETELGTGTGTGITVSVPIRGFVEKVSVGTEVQKLCALAVDMAENKKKGSGTNGKTANSNLSNNSSDGVESNTTNNNNNNNNNVITPLTDLNKSPDSLNSSKISDPNQSANGILNPKNSILGSNSKENDFEYCVKVLRWLECEGHVKSEFRVKFLTWFSLRASLQEKRVVRVYVESFIDDPASLAGQLADTFSEADCKRARVVSGGLCMKLWH